MNIYLHPKKSVSVEYHFSCDPIFTVSISFMMIFLYSITVPNNCFCFYFFNSHQKSSDIWYFYRITWDFVYWLFFPLIVSEMLLFTAAVTNISSKACISAHNLFVYVCTCFDLSLNSGDNIAYIHISSLFSRSDGSEKKLHSLWVTIFLATVTSWKQGRFV